MKKTTIKLTVSVQMKQDLQNVAALSGGSVPEVIRGYLRDALYSPPRPTEVHPPRAPRVSGKKNKKKKKNNNSLTTGKTTILPPDFDPPEHIARKYNLDHQGAVKRFRDWATASHRGFTDWNEAFAVACNTWLPEVAPELRLDPERKLYDGDRDGVDAL